MASRPLRVDELAEFLALDFKAGPIPKFHEGWRLDDPVDAVLSTCPSLLAIIDVGGYQIIQFSHFSVKEFLTSARLANTQDRISCYHVSMASTHTLAVQACLGILLHPNRDISKDGLQKFTLARYAALHWADHARFEDVSRNVEEGINNLFDSTKPHLAAWISLHNKELPSWKLLKRGERPLQSSGTPLHYATVCGLHAFVKVLIGEHKHDVDSQDLNKSTPLHMASLRGHENVACVLLDCGADVAAKDKDGWTPLHVASEEGHLEVVRVLLEHGAPTTAQDKDGWTPLHVALQARDEKDILLDHSADDYGRTAQMDSLSFLVSQGASLHAARDVLRRGAGATAQDEDGSIPYDVGLRHGRVGVVNFSLDNEAEVTGSGEDEWSNLASRIGHVKVVRILVEHGADTTAQNKNGWTPLHSASLNGHVEVARFLVERGADATAQNKNGWTPLHSASQHGHVEVARFLVEHGARTKAQNKNGTTPLHPASENGHLEVARFLVEHGADPTAKNKNGWTPLHSASQHGHVEVAQFLVEHGARTKAQNKNGTTPLHPASENGHVEVARFLVEHGADATAKNKNGSTPLHLASQHGHVEISRILVERGADPTAQEDGETPLQPLP